MKCSRISALAICLSSFGLSAFASQTSVTLTGGEQQTSANIFDNGTFSITVGGKTETVPYGKFSTLASVASGLAAKFSLDCTSPVIAYASGATIKFTTRDPASDMANISAVAQWDQNDFQLPSFALNVQAPILTPTFTCTPGTIISGENLTCAVSLAVGASSPVSLTLGGVAWLSANPDPTTGIAVASGIVTESNSSVYQVAYSYPGDSSVSLPAASGTTSVTVDMPGTQLSGSTLYQFQIVQPGGASGYDPVGNVIGYNDSVNGAWALGYDSLNRLVSSVASPVNGPAQYGCWAYDSFSNILTQSRSSQSFSGGSCQAQSGATTLQSTYNYTDGTNHITSGSWLDANNNTHTGSPVYDGAGNMTSDLSNSYLYDAEERVCAVQAGSNGPIIGYLYDAEGHRVAKGTLSSMTCDPTQLQVTATYFIGPDGEAMTELDGQGNWVRTEVSAAGLHLATYTPTGIHYPLTDWLGTKRMQVNPNMTLNNGIEEMCMSLPFGDGLNCSTPIDASPRHFTGKERDAESGLDYFGARYYASNMGRFMSPDWSAKYEPVPYAKLDNPQSLNLYAYVLNNPLSNRDEDGHSTDADKDKKLPAPDAQHNHTITVREVQGQGGNAFGHVTVQIDGGKEVGYGPKQDMTTTQIVEGKSVPGQVEPRADGVKTVDQVTINVTGDQAKAAQGAIDDRAANPGNYNLTSNNCAQFGTTVVNAAGGNAPNDIKPSSLISDIRSQQYKANSTQTPTPAPQQQQHQPQ